MSYLTETLVAMAAIAIVIGVGMYVAEHVTCWHIPYLVNECVISK